MNLRISIAASVLKEASGRRNCMPESCNREFKDEDINRFSCV
jgi:hypothetical protein